MADSLLPQSLLDSFIKTAAENQNNLDENNSSQFASPTENTSVDHVSPYMKCNEPGCNQVFARASDLNSHRRKDHGHPVYQRDSKNKIIKLKNVPQYF